MTKLVRSGLLALILTALPLSLTTLAQTGTGTDRTTNAAYSDANDDRDWGWLGLLGLVGLAGLLRRRDAHNLGDVPGTARSTAR